MRLTDGILLHNTTLKKIRIGTVTIDPPLVLAPMAGLTHVALRQIVASFGGCGLYVSEMLSTRSILHHDITQDIYVPHLTNERPFFYQIFGSDPREMALAVKVLENIGDEQGRGPDGIDINMGCGAPAIRKKGAGAGLMQNVELAKRIVSACRAATRLPLTAKIRLGWEENSSDLVMFAVNLQEEGIDAITLHPRLAKEKFKKSARWEYVRILKEELSIPVIGNGDIRTPEDVKRRLSETNCDGVMIGRAAVTRPWIFRDCVNGEKAEVDLEEIFIQFVALLIAHFPPECRFVRLKNFVNYFAQNFSYGHILKYRVLNARTFEKGVAEARAFFSY